MWPATAIQVYIQIQSILLSKYKFSFFSISYIYTMTPNNLYLSFSLNISLSEFHLFFFDNVLSPINLAYNVWRCGSIHWRIGKPPNGYTLKEKWFFILSSPRIYQLHIAPQLGVRSTNHLPYLHRNIGWLDL